MTLLGPDGAPIHKSGLEIITRDMAAAHLAAAQDGQVVEVLDVAGQTISKVVRNRATSFSNVSDRERGKQKYGLVDDLTLRLLSQRNEWVRAILTTRKNQLGGKSWNISVKDEDPSGAAAKAAKAMEKLLRHPSMYGSQPNSRTWRSFLGMYLEDLLVLDRAAIEKERDGKGWIVALYPVDGATIRPNIDERGGYYPDAYVQVVDGQVTARFGMEELVCSVQNEQTDVRYAGYGMSPLENAIVSITADLHAAKFNSSYFEKGAVPEGLLSLGEGANADDVDAFRNYWAAEIAGKPWNLPITGGSKDPAFLQWRDSNRDMQFMEYQSWLLQKLCAIFQISKQDLGEIEDVNRSTADSQESSGRENGLEPLMAAVKDMVDLEIIGEHGQGLGDYLEFAWEEQGESADEINAKMQPMHAAGVATGSEWRDAHGMDPEGDPKATHGKEGLRMHLKGDSPLPGKEDADTMGAKAQQGREDEMHAREQDAPGAPTGVAWSRPGADDPDVKDAQEAHDEERGIGPRQVSKSLARARPFRHDHTPALTEHSDGLEDVFAQASGRLVAALAGILGGDDE